jgi:hypothetical protein
MQVTLMTLAAPDILKTASGPLMHFADDLKL